MRSIAPSAASLITSLLLLASACGGSASQNETQTLGYTATIGPAPVQLDAAGGASNGPLTPPPAAGAAAVTEVGSLGASIAGALGGGPGASSEVDAAGRYVARHRVRLEAGTRVRFLVRARPDFDPMLRLEGPGGVSLAIDDVLPHRLDALIELVPSVTGEYEAIVSAWGRGRGGPYRLEITPQTPSGEALSLGGRVESTLGASSDPIAPGASFFRFDADGGSVVRLRVTSPSFDTIATVLAPNGQRWQNDDANDTGPNGSERPLDSTIELSAPVSGTYLLVVSGYGSGSGGAFSVQSSVRAPVVYREGETVPRGSFAGPGGRGRILGLYSGITDYASGPLYGCADDARMLGEAFRAAHLQRVDEQIVLTDHDATRERFLGGIRELARRAGPDDVVVVFFSGHGDVEPVPAPSLTRRASAPGSASDPIELDGTNERIIFVDGALTDDEVVTELSRVRAGTVVLAIDACYSGGFADDWLRAPGRIGLFSSDSDVLSETAQPRQAGGYLAWYLRRGVLGEADAKPRDGMLLAGELTDYLLEGMVQDHRLMNRDGSLEPAQRFVLRRGSVGWVDPLWVYPRAEDLALPSLPAVALTSAPR